MIKWIVRIDWQDIIASNNTSRYSKCESPKNITFGILFKEFTLNKVKYLRILRNAVVSDDIGDMETDDIIDIPKMCVSDIKRYEKIEIGKHYEIIDNVSGKKRG